MKNYLAPIIGYGLMASLILMPTVGLAKGNNGNDNGNGHGNGHQKTDVSATTNSGDNNSNDPDNDGDSDSGSHGNGNGNAFGHLIAPGFIKHHGAPTTVSPPTFPFGIGRLFEFGHGHSGTTTPTMGAPSIFFVSARPGATSATVTWVTNQPSSSQVSYGTNTSDEVTTSLDSSLRYFHSVTITGLASATTYQYDVISTNSSDVTGTSPNETFTTTGTGTSTTEPVISDIAVSGVSSTTATVTWTSDEPSTSEMNYGTTTGYDLTTGVNTTDSTSHSETVSGLAASTVYHFDVVSEDASSNTSTSPDQTFTTLNMIEPVLSNLVVSEVGSTSATVSWTTDEPTNSEVFFGTSSPLDLATSAFVADSALVINHIIQLSALAANTLYTIVIQSTDSASNTATSSAQSFSTLP